MIWHFDKPEKDGRYVFAKCDVNTEPLRVIHLADLTYTVKGGWNTYGNYADKAFGEPENGQVYAWGEMDDIELDIHEDYISYLFDLAIQKRKAAEANGAANSGKYLTSTVIIPERNPNDKKE